ncbi:HK97 gp10 family phage protein [Providencia rustigianii]|uniref:HK97 gp10 family phage protein n=1 Tax=Providencia rustigianii TaxID=158850 RepID=UPI00224055A7|nr:HK97 gp10 family phage protein [Providencia rustigianii]
MAKRVRGISECRRNTQAFVDDVNRRAVRAVTAGLIVGASHAARYTPIDTSTLINSQYRDVRVNGVMITGRVGYSANYAVYVHEASGKLKGEPRNSGSGNYWDPNAKPKFLQAGFEEARQEIDEAIKREMRR